MCMDDIEFIRMLECDGGADHGVPRYFFHQIFTVFAGEFVFLAILYPEAFDLPLPLVFHHLGKILRVNVWNHIRADVYEPHLSEELID